MSFLFVGTSSRNLTYSAAHNHSCYEIILNTEGEGVATIGNTEYPFYPGSVHIIPQNVPHTKYSEGGFRDIYIQTETLTSPISGILKAGPICLTDDNENSLTELMKMMLYRYMGDHKNRAVLYLLYELVLKLIEEQCTALSVDPVIENICHTLMLHFNDPEFSLAKVLEDTGYQKDYIRRKFVSVCGVTPGEYLTALRIENAKKLLKEQKQTRFSIADIGTMCGYYDERYFSRVFKKRVGVTPTEFAAQ